MTDASPTPEDAGVHTAPDEVWEQVREDYLAGWSAPACCRRHGVGLSTLRKRAADEGWRRTDQPWSRPNGLERDDEGLALEEQFDGDLDQIPLGELSLVAFQRMMRAVLHGKAMEALRWRRVHRMIQVEAAEVQRRYQKAERDRRDLALAAWKPGKPIDGIDGIDGVFSPSPQSAPSTTILPGLPGGMALAGAP